MEYNNINWLLLKTEYRIFFSVCVYNISNITIKFIMFSKKPKESLSIINLTKNIYILKILKNISNDWKLGEFLWVFGGAM